MSIVAEEFAAKLGTITLSQETARRHLELLRQVDHTLIVHGKIDAHTDLHSRIIKALMNVADQVRGSGSNG